jgi:hypothetical protein
VEASSVTAGVSSSLPPQPASETATPSDPSAPTTARRNSRVDTARGALLRLLTSFVAWVMSASTVVK